MHALFTPFARASTRQMQIAAVALGVGIVLIWSLKLHPLFPTPLEVWDKWLFQVNERGLMYNMMISFRLNLEALSISLVIAALLSYGQVIPVVRQIVRFMETFRFLSAGALVFTMSIIIQDPHWVKVTVVCFAMLPFILTGLASSVRTVEDNDINHARTLKLGHWGTTWQVVIRGRLHDLFEVVRQNFSIGWYMTPVVEGIFRSEGGVGLMIVEQNRYLKLDDAFAILLTIFVAGLLQDQVLRYLRKKACPHATIGAGAFG